MLIGTVNGKAYKGGEQEAAVKHTAAFTMGRLSMHLFYAQQWTPVPPLEPVDLAGQTVLVVGANAGLGLEAAKYFARMRPGKLALACRSVKKSEDAAKGMSHPFIQKP
jgi:hypothetical protein